MKRWILNRHLILKSNRMKNLLYISFCSLFFFSCNKEKEDTNTSSSMYVPTYVATEALVGETTISNITSSSATCNSNIINDGQASVTARGVCYSAEHSPTTSDQKITNGSGIGTFTTIITGLSSGTVYYVRTYATNNAGTAYGDEVSFSTN